MGLTTTTVTLASQHAVPALTDYEREITLTDGVGGPGYNFTAYEDTNPVAQIKQAGDASGVPQPTLVWLDAANGRIKWTIPIAQWGPQGNPIAMAAAGAANLPGALYVRRDADDADFPNMIEKAATLAVTYVKAETDDPRTLFP